MNPLLLNPWTYVVAGALLLGTAGAGFGSGYMVRGWKCGKAAGAAVTRTERAEDTRDENIETIASAAASAAAAAVNQNRSDTHASVHTIRTVEVAGDCRAVPDVILRELRAGTDAANAALGVGVRPGAAEPGSTDR